MTAYESQDNPKLDEKDVTMDFFPSLDNARYIHGDFKVDTMNCMTSKSMEPTENLNPVKVVKSLNGLRILLIKFQTDLKFQRVRSYWLKTNVQRTNNLTEKIVIKSGRRRRRPYARTVLYCIVLYWGA